VDEAIRLMRSSTSSLDDDDDDARATARRRDDPTGAVYAIVREVAAESSTVAIADCEPAVLARGYTREQMMESLQEYEELSIWSVDWNKEQITFLA